MIGKFDGLKSKKAIQIFLSCEDGIAAYLIQISLLNI